MCILLAFGHDRHYTYTGCKCAKKNFTFKVVYQFTIARKKWEVFFGNKKNLAIDVKYAQMY